jgi:uncharacterized protein YegL
MDETRGHLLPVYVLVDESDSMKGYVDDLNAGLRSLHEALLAAPMAAAKVRFSVLGFSDTVVTRLHLADLRRVDRLPAIKSRAKTYYGAAFAALLTMIPQDVQALKRDRYAVHRPAVFFLSDGLPTDAGHWPDTHRRLVDRVSNRAAPNIIACGIGAAQAAVILAVATDERFAFVSIAGTHIGREIAKFCTALTHSLVLSSRLLGSDNAELFVNPPEGFRMAIDVI